MDAPPPTLHVVIVGAGNIGSALAPLLGRINAIGRLTMIDHDMYAAKNLVSQSITPGDVGQPKAEVQVRRLREMNPALRVEALVARVENVPLGALRSAVICGCVDSRHARSVIAEAAWRLGVPYVDAGVMADGWLARVSVFVPGADNACLLCPWSERDFDLLEQSYSCTGDAPETFATNAPAFLGALAASVQAVEVQRLLEGDTSGAGVQTLFDARARRHFVTKCERNAECRFDHAQWPLETLDRGADAFTFRDALALGGSGALRVAGQPFVAELACPACSLRAPIFRLRGRLTATDTACPACAAVMRPVGFSMLERLTAAEIPAALHDSPLSAAGCAAGDILLVNHKTADRCFVLC